jgi:hypothetical protein
MTKSTYFIIVFAILLTCCREPVQVAQPLKVSLAQTSIQKLVDSFKTDVRKLQDIKSQNSIRIKYSYRFYNLFSNIYLDSIRVHVDTVFVDSLTITTVFHCNKEISFKGSLTFPKTLEPKHDSLFRFMKNLKAGSDTMLSFNYMGNQEVRLPSQEGPIIKIFAFPIPIWTKKY